MSIKVKIAKAHESQLNDLEIKKEFESIQQGINKVEIEYTQNTINFVFIKGIYIHNERKMITACLFVNKMTDPIKEIHGVLQLNFITEKAEIAKATVAFDQPFIGSLKPNEALLVHIGIPVIGLSQDKEFSISDIAGNFENVRVALC